MHHKDRKLEASLYHQKKLRQTLFVRMSGQLPQRKIALWLVLGLELEG